MFLVGLFFLAACVVGPLYLLFGPPTKERRAMPESPPVAYVAFGLPLFLLSAYAWAVVSFGYLLPAWGLIAPNAFTLKTINVPRKHGRSQALTLQDADMSFMMSVLAGFVMALGAYLVVRGILLYLRGRPAPP